MAKSRSRKGRKSYTPAIHNTKVKPGSKPLWKKVIKITLIVIASVLLAIAAILRIRHFFIKHW